MNTMLMSVFERTREIGILRAIGWGRGLILRQILTEGLLISLLGGALGMALGMAIVEGTGSLPGFGWIAGDYGPVLFVQSSAVAVGMGLFGTLYPAWRAVRITPIEALRYE
jgi:putative ABC transport system permease protein